MNCTTLGCEGFNHYKNILHIAPTLHPTGDEGSGGMCNHPCQLHPPGTVCPHPYPHRHDRRLPRHPGRYQDADQGNIGYVISISNCFKH